MIRELTLVWLSSASPQAHQAELGAWAKAQNVQLLDPAPFQAAAYDPAAAEEIEVRLENARAAATLTQDAVEQVDTVCRQIAAQPQLPQAPWLLAECHRMAALALAQAGNPVEAAQRLKQALVLEGSRATPYGPLEATLPPLEPAAVVEIQTLGPRDGDAVYLDGKLTEPRTLTTVGTHHVRVVRAGQVIGVGWIEVEPEGGKVPLPLTVPPCSSADLASVRIEGNAVTQTQGVLCPAWLIARPAHRNSFALELWTCEADRCTGPAPWPPPRAAREAKPKPAAGVWYIWPLVGAGVALGTAAVLWQTGAFDSNEAPARSFSITGPGADTSLVRF